MNPKRKEKILFILGVIVAITFWYAITALVCYGLGWIKWTNTIWWSIAIFIIAFIVGNKIYKIKS